MQSVLAAHKTAADATKVHHHYLKGSVFCGECGSRLLITNARNRHGSIYPYFVCAGRHSKRTTCTRHAVMIESVERLIENYYEHVALTPEHRQALAGMLRFEFDRMMAAETEELSALTSKRDQLEAEQLRLLQAHYADAIPLTLLKREQGRILAELDQINHRLEQQHGEYATVNETLEKSLELLDDVAGLYRRCDDVTRRLCNQAFFTKIYLDEAGTLRPD
ncbi:MAG: recombinase zinc beta ribbon domain-containing protein [Marmoricola sp.]